MSTSHAFLSKVFAALALSVTVTACAMTPGPTYPPASAETVRALRALENHACAPATAAVLDAHGIAPASLDWVKTFTESNGQSGGVGYLAMFALKGQRGYFSVRETFGCDVRDVYAAQGAVLPPRRS